jgi:hypothetical protein
MGRIVAVQIFFVGALAKACGPANEGLVEHPRFFEGTHEGLVVEAGLEHGAEK